MYVRNSWVIVQKNAFPYVLEYDRPELLPDLLSVAAEKVKSPHFLSVTGQWRFCIVWVTRQLHLYQLYSYNLPLLTYATPCLYISYVHCVQLYRS